MIDRVRQFIRRHSLIPSGARVIAAVSGGSDSVALAHLLRELDAQGGLRLVGVVHFNHGLRAAAADDERFCAGVAAAIDRPFRVEAEDVAARRRREHRSLEDAARVARYEGLERARRHFGADLVALGHTRDDQAETALLRLIRGAGPRGLAGMRPRIRTVVRPLLACRRAELREWLGARGVAFVDDESNVDVSIPRNRVRAELLPLLEARFNPSIVDVLADEAALARETWEWMSGEADRLAPPLVRLDNGARGLDLPSLRALPPALRRLTVFRAMSDVGGARPIAFRHVSDALRLVEPDGPPSLDAPGQRVERIGSRLVLTAGSARRGERPSNLFRYSLSIPGEVPLPEAGWVLSAEPLSSPGAVIENGAVAGNGTVAVVRGDLISGPLAVRNRRPGDRFRPVGLEGHKKLQDFFVDRKIARGARDRVPLVVDEADRIVWVAGYGIDAAFRVTDVAQAVLILKLRPA